MGVVMSPFSLPVMQMGFDRYLELLYEQPELFERLMRVNEEFCVAWANAQIDAGATAIGYFDPVSSPTIVPKEVFMGTGRHVARRTISRIAGPVATHFGSGLSLPLVDDNTTSREVLSAYIASWGTCPVQAPDGPTALRELHSALDAGKPFDLALIDMQMPGMDGESLVRSIATDPRLTGTPMVMMGTMAARATLLGQPEGSGVLGYLTKPVRKRELLAILSQALSRAAGRGVTATPPPRGAPGPALLRCEGRDARILLADDNVTNQQVALGILEKLGLRADTAVNGQEVVTALEDTAYDLVLMDVQMPVMDGYEVTRAVRDQRSAVLDHQVPIIAMTSCAMHGDKQQCLEAGMNGYVAKPVKAEVLARELRKWLTADELERGGDLTMHAGNGAGRVRRQTSRLGPCLAGRTSAR
jgi:CheY-like chemotaxis protein